MIDEEEDIYAFLEHHGVRGMRWGVRRARSAQSESPKDRLAKINKKTNKMNAESIYGGAGYVGYYQKKRQSQHPHAKAKARLALRGAAEAAVILGGGTLLINRLHISPQTARGAKMSLALLTASTVGVTRVSQIHDVGVYKKHAELIKEKNAIEKGMKRRSK